jgi:putative ABC transport system permease protein
LISVLSMAIAVGSIVPSGPVRVLLAVVVAVFLIAGPVTVVCARRAMRVRPIESLGLE